MENNSFDFSDMRKTKALRLLSCYKEFEAITKSLESNLEKSGEGSRGGKVIGHTKSGKPIYESHEQLNTQNFSSEDHSDAVSQHMKESKMNSEEADDYDKGGHKDGKSARSIYHRTKSKHHSQMAELHSNAMNSKLDNKVEKAGATGKELKELVDEHKKLIKVIESPSKEDDKKEVEDQKEELEGYEAKLKKSYDILGLNNEIEKGGEHFKHKYIRKEGDKYIYEDKNGMSVNNKDTKTSTWISAKECKEMANANKLTFIANHNIHSFPQRRSFYKQDSAIFLVGDNGRDFKIAIIN